MSFPRYPAYKDSGIPLLKEIPEEWLCIKLQEAASDAANSFVDGPFGSSLKNEEYVGQGVPLVQLNNIGIGRHILSTLNFVEPEKADELGRHNAFPGDLVIAKMADPVARAAIVSDQFARYVIVADCIRLEPDISRMDPRFLVYSINSPYFKALAEMASKGIGRVRINLGSLRQLQLCCPPVDIQRRIATFLDHETAKIDALIAEQQRLIELLQEKRQAVISHAVTKGLNPDLPMKDSGVEWLGEVPEHWEVKQLRYVCNLQTGSRDTENAVEGGPFPFFVRSQTVERINSSAFDCEAVLTAGDGAGVGKVFHYHHGPFDFHQRVYMMNNFRGISGRLFFYALRETFYKVALEGGAKSTVDSLRRPMFMSFPICMPPTDEQELILSHVETQTHKYSELASEAHRAVGLLQERRSALISAAVTGQIDVRGLVPEVAAA